MAISLRTIFVNVYRRDTGDAEMDDFPFAVERTAKGNRQSAGNKSFRCLLTWWIDGDKWLILQKFLPSEGILSFSFPASLLCGMLALCNFALRTPYEGFHRTGLLQCGLFWPRFYITIPIARWIAFSISIIFIGLMVPEKEPRIKKDLSRVVICSHLAMEVCSRPPSPSANSTWVGLVRRVVEIGTKMTSLAKRFRTSKEAIRAGLDFVFSGWPGSLTR